MHITPHTDLPNLENACCCPSTSQKTKHWDVQGARQSGPCRGGMNFGAADTEKWYPQIRKMEITLDSWCLGYGGAWMSSAIHGIPRMYVSEMRMCCGCSGSCRGLHRARSETQTTETGCNCLQILLMHLNYWSQATIRPHKFTWPQGGPATGSRFADKWRGIAMLLQTVQALPCWLLLKLAVCVAWIHLCPLIVCSVASRRACADVAWSTRGRQLRLATLETRTTDVPQY